MQEALGKFQQSMFQLSRQARAGQTTGNLANPSTKDIAAIEKTWEDGRQALNVFYQTLNTATSIDRLVTIPPDGKGSPLWMRSGGQSRRHCSSPLTPRSACLRSRPHRLSSV